jgi:hypothetical protein
LKTFIKMASKAQQLAENFALYDVLASNGCKVQIPMALPTMTEEDAYREAIQMIEAWSHEHNNTVDNFVEFCIGRKIQVFCKDGPRTLSFFREFLTYMIYSGDEEDWEIPRKVFGAVANKKCIKYLWTTRFNLLSYLNKKELLYKSLKKLYVSTEQATNLSPKFFGKQVGDVMSTFVAELNANSIKIRNKDVISVAKWSELLFSRFLQENPTSIIPYVSRKGQPSGGSFISKCFENLEHIPYQQARIEEIIHEKEEEGKTRPKDIYRGIYHAYAGTNEIKHLTGKSSSPERTRTTVSERPKGDLTEIEKKAFATQITANYNVNKMAKTAGAPSDAGNKPQGFGAYFASTNKKQLKNFREQENYARRALLKDQDITKKYDFKPADRDIENAFKSCLIQKNRGKFDKIYQEQSAKLQLTKHSVKQ